MTWIDGGGFVAVGTWIVKESRWPVETFQALRFCLETSSHDTGEVPLTHREIAKRLSLGTKGASLIMGELLLCAAVVRRRANGRVRYFVNPRIGTHLTGAARDRAQDEAPPLLALLKS